MSNFSPETAGWRGGRLRLVAIPQILIQSPLLPAFPVLSQKVPISATVSGDSDSTSPTSDSDYDTDSDLARVLAPNLNPNLRVAKIQLEVKRFLSASFKGITVQVVPSISSTLVVSERLCHGSEVVSTTRYLSCKEL